MLLSATKRAVVAAQRAAACMVSTSSSLHGGLVVVVVVGAGAGPVVGAAAPLHWLVSRLPYLWALVDAKTHRLPVPTAFIRPLRAWSLCVRMLGRAIRLT
jgi:hypothetical protein